ADTTLAMTRKQLSEAPPPLRLHREGLADWCEPIVQRALAKAPAHRFRTAHEFRGALRTDADWPTAAARRPFDRTPRGPEAAAGIGPALPPSAATAVLPIH